MPRGIPLRGGRDPRAKPELANCARCGRRFAPYRVTARYCTDDCRYQAANERRRSSSPTPAEGGSYGA